MLEEKNIVARHFKIDDAQLIKRERGQSSQEFISNGSISFLNFVLVLSSYLFDLHSYNIMSKTNTRRPQKKSTLKKRQDWDV